MAASEPQPRFPLALTVMTVTVIAGAMLGLLLLVLPMLFPETEGVRRAALIMSVCVWGSGVASLFPVLLPAPNPLVFVQRYMLGSGARVAICLIAMTVSRKGFDLPGGPVAISLVATYLPILCAETATVFRHVKRLKPGSPPAGDGSKQDAASSLKARSTAYEGGAEAADDLGDAARRVRTNPGTLTRIPAIQEATA